MKKVLRSKNTEYGTVGEESPFKDANGVKLHVGDVVGKFNGDISGEKSLIVKTDDYGCFVMGIQCRCNGSTGEIEDWIVKLAKAYNSLEVGERYGFITVVEVEEEIKEEETEGLKVGDIVTSTKGKWLEGAYAKIIKIENERATIEVIDKGTREYGCCSRAGFTDSGWKLEWLVKANDFKQPEQLKDNIKEDDIVFKVGDAVRGCKGSSKEYGVTNERMTKAKVIKVSENGNIDVKILEHDNEYEIGENYTALEPKYFEKIDINENAQQLEITTSGTTTKVKFEDGREGVAKLYYKDTYNKGFGIVAALGKAMDIDLVGEVQKVVESYKVEGNKPKLTIVDEAAFEHTFKVGDIVRGNSSVREWGITNEHMTRAEELKIGDYICYKMHGEYSVCKINKTENDKLWGDWSRCDLSVLPKTISEFEKIKKSNGNGFMRIGNPLLKKLDLIDDTKTEIKVGDKVSKQQAMDIIDAGGSIKFYGNRLYFKEQGVLKYKNERGHIAISSG